MGAAMTDKPSFDHTRAPTQLYLISPADVDGDFPQRLARALDAGLKGRHRIAAFQFRVKGLDDHAAARLAAPLQAICAEREIAFIVNDSLTLAKRLNADGVHLGQDDLAREGGVKVARQELGSDAQIGVTCHSSRHLALEAGEAGADYVAFGAYYPTTTKEVEHYAEPDLLTWWQGLFEIPCVAIGGITAENAAPLVQAGADFLAVSGAVWNGDEAANVKALMDAILAAQ
jgi:thiamine-phosphate pyrophosphorylase